jgi:hypothetical protein
MTRPIRTRSLPHRLSRTIPLSVAALVALCCSSVSIAAATSASSNLASQHLSANDSTTKRSSLAGKWAGKYSGAYTGTFTLQWTLTRTRLHGSITLNPGGTYTITGSVHGSKISFGAVGAGATYTGSVSGRSMSGRYNTAKGGGRWSAHKTSR